MAKSKLDKLANICVILSSFLVIAWIIDAYTGRNITRIIDEWRRPRMNTPELLKAAGWQQGDVALVILVSTACGACKRDLPSYAKLLREESLLGKVKPVFLGPQSHDEIEKMVSHSGISATVASANLVQLGIRATPTIVLVDRRGSVRASWEGAISNRYSDVVTAIANSI